MCTCIKKCEKRKIQFIKVGLPYFWCLFTCFIFSPLELYFTNAEELWFGLSDFLPLLTIVVAILWTVLMFLHIVLTKKIMLAVWKILWILSVCLYIQGDFIPVSYGVMNGTEIDWNHYRAYGYVNSCIWIVLIAAFIFLCSKYGKKVEGAIPVLSAAMLIMQITAIVSLIIPNLKNSADNQYYLTNKGMYEVGSDQNTIVFILDAFDSEVFSELLSVQNEAWISQFDGFHYYHDTVGGATRTRYAIPYILSGQPYTKRETYKEYINGSAEKSTLYEQIKKKKIHACLYTEPVYVGDLQAAIIDNYEQTKLKSNSVLGLTCDFLKLTAFRNFPHILKKYFWIYSGDLDVWKTSANSENEPYSFDDVQFYSDLMSNKLSVGDYREAFRFYHLMGAHAPYTMNENIERVSSDKTSELQQALGSLKIVNAYIDQLKELGLYESAAIIIMADHGCVRGIEQNPLFMIKPASGKGDFLSSDFPLSYANLPDIFYAAFHGESRYPEEYVTEINPRLFYVGGGTNAVLDYMEYVVPGHAYDHSCVKSTGNVFHGTMNGADCQYVLGTLLQTEDWSLNAHCISGFSENEITHTWTDGYEAVMQFDFSEKFNNLKVTMDYIAFDSNQKVYIYANDRQVACYIADGREPDTFLIPKDYIKDGHLEIKFELPDAECAVPNGRKLTLAMKSMVISSTDEDVDLSRQIQKLTKDLQEEK